MYSDVVMAGFGGQGVLLVGNILAYAAMEEGYHVTFMPSYGVEMRGGTANCTVVISDQPIGSPVVGRPGNAVIFNEASLIRFETLVRPKGLILLNTSLVDRGKVSRKDISYVFLPFNKLAGEVGGERLANMVALGAYATLARPVGPETIKKSLYHVIPPKRHSLIDANIRAIEHGAKEVQ